MRDHNQEYQDTAEAKYQYDFDLALRRYLVRTLQPFYPQPGKALELGCYKGDFTTLLESSFDDLTVVEASGELIDVARKRVGARVRFIHSTFEGAELPPEFDAVFLIHTLEHLDDAPGVLRKIRSWLSPAGRLFVAVPNANAPSRQIAVSMGLIDFNSAVTEAERVHGHRKTYSLDTLLFDVRSAGLSVEQCGGVFFKPLANYQFDQLMGGDVISDAYLEGCYRLGMRYPDLCADVYAICVR